MKFEKNVIKSKKNILMLTDWIDPDGKTLQVFF
jgi:hypothetical protein